MRSTGLRNTGPAIVGLSAIALFSWATFSLVQNLRQPDAVPCALAGWGLVFAPASFWLLAGSIARGIGARPEARAKTRSAALMVLAICGLASFALALALV